MEAIDIIAIIVGCLFMAVLIVLSLYCLVFCHEDYKKWKDILGMIDEFYYVYSYRGSHVFKEPSCTFEIIVWANGEASVHRENNGDCILSTSNRYFSKKVAKRLIK